MTTMTLMEARTNLDELCRRAKNDEDVGIVFGRQVLRLIPTKVNRQNPVVLIPIKDRNLRRDKEVPKKPLNPSEPA